MVARERAALNFWCDSKNSVKIESLAGIMGSIPTNRNFYADSGNTMALTSIACLATSYRIA